MVLHLAGLFIGIELVLDRTERSPAPEAAGYIVERMRDKGILISVDGVQKWYGQ